MGPHFRGNETAHFQQLEVDEFLVLADALQFREGVVDRRHGGDPLWTAAFGLDL